MRKDNERIPLVSSEVRSLSENKGGVIEVGDLRKPRRFVIILVRTEEEIGQDTYQEIQIHLEYSVSVRPIRGGARAGADASSGSQIWPRGQLAFSTIVPLRLCSVHLGRLPEIACPSGLFQVPAPGSISFLKLLKLRQQLWLMFKS